MMDFPELFLRCLEVVLRNEGGYSNNPADPGGSTMKGVTQKEYDSYRAKQGDSYRDVRLISDEELWDIYYILYWLPMNLDIINDDDLVLQVYDMGVNAGIRTSIKILQRLVGVTDDGYIGQETNRAIKEYNGDILEDFKKRRKLFYVTLKQNKPQLKPFLIGWLNRVDNCHF
jgi:lysozyme family protein